MLSSLVNNTCYRAFSNINQTLSKENSVIEHSMQEAVNSILSIPKYKVPCKHQGQQGNELERGKKENSVQPNWFKLLESLTPTDLF